MTCITAARRAMQPDRNSIMRLWLVTLAHKSDADRRRRRDHYVRPKIVLADDADETARRALAESAIDHLVGYRIQDLGDQRVYDLASNRMSRAELTRLHRDATSGWTFLTADYDEPPQVPFVISGPLRLHDDA
jgi:hypothetical protein